MNQHPETSGIYQELHLINLWLEAHSLLIPPKRSDESIIYKIMAILRKQMFLPFLLQDFELDVAHTANMIYLTVTGRHLSLFLFTNLMHKLVDSLCDALYCALSDMKSLRCISASSPFIGFYVLIFSLCSPIRCSIKSLDWTRLRRPEATTSVKKLR